MRQEEACAGGCSERKLELVSGDDYDQLIAAAADCRARIQGLRAVAGELARTEPGPGEWQATYEALQRSARAALRHYRPAPGDPAPGGPGDAFPVPGTVTVWRCPDCGSVDAPQECIGVCIWHPAEWVDAAGVRSGAPAGRGRSRYRTGPGGAAPHARVRDAAGRALGAERACPARGRAAAWLFVLWVGRSVTSKDMIPLALPDWRCRTGAAGLALPDWRCRTGAAGLGRWPADWRCRTGAAGLALPRLALPDWRCRTGSVRRDGDYPAVRDSRCLALWTPGAWRAAKPRPRRQHSPHSFRPPGCGPPSAPSRSARAPPRGLAIEGGLPTPRVT